MKTDKEPTVTVRFTLDVDRTLKLTQHDKPSHYSNVEWAKQHIENVCQELEMCVDGRRVECQYRIIEGELPEEIATEDEEEAS